MRSGQSEYLTSTAESWKGSEIQEMFMGVGLGPDLRIIEQGRIGYPFTKPIGAPRQSSRKPPAVRNEIQKTRRRLRGEAKWKSSKVNLSRRSTDIVVESKKTAWFR